MKQIQSLVATRFNNITVDEQNDISRKIDALNTVTACSFCNSTTSRNVSEKTMEQLLNVVQGSPEEVISYIASELQMVLARKRKDVEWKLASIRKAFETEVATRINSSEG